MGWMTFEEGTTLGEPGDDGGVVVRDEEYDGLCRITLEQESAFAPFALTCGLYGAFFHTRFFPTRAEADREFEAMQSGLAALVDSIPLSDDPEAESKREAMQEEIERFIARFP